MQEWVGAIFHIRWENGFFVSQGSWEWDLIMLVAVPSIILLVQEEFQLHML